MVWRFTYVCFLLCKILTPSLCSSQCSSIDSNERCSSIIGGEKSIILHDSVILKFERITNDDNIIEVRNKINYDLWKYIEGGMGDGPGDDEGEIEIPVYSANCRPNSNADWSQKLFQPSKGTVLLVEDQKLDPVPPGLTPAAASLPCMLYIAQSPMIPADDEKPGNGVFTKIPLPKGLLFSPYKGSRIKILRKDEHLYELTYAWKYFKGDDHDYYIDGIDENNSNWLRFINSARFEEEQNMMSMKDDKGNIYYYLYKDVAPNTELLVYYGQSVLDVLGIKYLSGQQQQLSVFARKRIEIECPACADFPPIDDGDI